MADEVDVVPAVAAVLSGGSGSMQGKKVESKAKSKGIRQREGDLRARYQLGSMYGGQTVCRKAQGRAELPPQANRLRAHAECLSPKEYDRSPQTPPLTKQQIDSCCHAGQAKREIRSSTHGLGARSASASSSYLCEYTRDL